MAESSKQPAMEASGSTTEDGMRRQTTTPQLDLINLESDTDYSETDDPEDTTLTHGQESNGAGSEVDKQITLATVNEKVDRLPGKFESFDKRLDKNAAKCRKKFMNIQSAHNTVIKSINTLSARADSSADINEQTRAMVNECLQKINELALKTDLQHNSHHTRLEAVEKLVVEIGTEVKEKKLVISGVKEEKG